MTAEQTEWEKWAESPTRKALLGEWATPVEGRILVARKHRAKIFQFLEGQSNIQDGLWVLTDLGQKISLKRSVRLFRHDLLHCEPGTYRLIATESEIRIIEQERVGLNARVQAHEMTIPKYMIMRDKLVEHKTEFVKEFRALGESEWVGDAAEEALLLNTRRDWLDGWYHKAKAEMQASLVAERNKIAAEKAAEEAREFAEWAAANPKEAKALAKRKAEEAKRQPRFEPDMSGYEPPSVADRTLDAIREQNRILEDIRSTERMRWIFDK